ncbi:B3 domain-containing REM20 -like protein [Gossypium arboreum]|uniref:B3 domain-containing REM20-like protein n=1 Tax=Gossypium arboreum TaxID=29729 RepID=A0A0B0PCA3_GOSAR|nr:B3 domain-containing REM20 -like protein [Gossypium arboreum]KHG20986.1 B3 domain-containing REM20 -like protein [Gossypium arboreum]
MIKKMFNFEAENFCKVYLATHSIHSVLIPATAIGCPLTPATTTLRNCNGQCWQVDLVKCDNKMYFRKGWRRFIDENSSIPCVVSEEEEEESESESESEDDDSDDANDEGADSTEVEDEEIHPEDYVQHLNPYFVVKTTKSSQRTNELYIPTGIAKDFGVSLEDGEKITFVDPYNRKSIGKVVKWKDQRTCIKGWRSVLNRNKVNLERDTCICEFLLENGQQAEIGVQTKSIQVHVISRWKPSESGIKASKKQKQK